MCMYIYVSIWRRHTFLHIYVFTYYCLYANYNVFFHKTTDREAQKNK